MAPPSGFGSPTGFTGDLLMANTSPVAVDMANQEDETCIATAS